MLELNTTAYNNSSTRGGNNNTYNNTNNINSSSSNSGHNNNNSNNNNCNVNNNNNSNTNTNTNNSSNSNNRNINNLFNANRGGSPIDARRASVGAPARSNTGGGLRGGPPKVARVRTDPVSGTVVVTSAAGNSGLVF